MNSSTEEVPAASLISTVRIESSVKPVLSFTRIKSFCIGQLYTFDLDYRSGNQSSSVDVKIRPRNSVPRYVVKLTSFVGDQYNHEFNEMIVIRSGIKCRPVIQPSQQPSAILLDFQLVFDIDFSPSYLDERSFMADVTKQLSTSDTVRLISSNGTVEVKKDFLTIRSSVFQAMFNNDTKEAKNLQVDMVNFNKEVLEAFVKFLMTDSIDNAENIAFQLSTLGDRYDIPLLKAEADRLMMNKIRMTYFLGLFKPS